jgi:hypothetical protein
MRRTYPPCFLPPKKKVGQVGRLGRVSGLQGRPHPQTDHSRCQP